MQLVAVFLILPWFFTIQGVAPLEGRGRAGSGPVRVVQRLYADHFVHDMAFTRASVARKSRWLSPALRKDLATWFHKPASPDQAPAINGDPFTDTQEYPKAFSVGTAILRGAVATVPVSFRVGDARRLVQVHLNRGPSGWRVSDLSYDDGSTFRRQLQRD
ncbi:MAG: hypothetical protein ABL986_03110 [Vicinamibacterales bacterium]